jgi:hypothetical protein
LLPTFVAIRDLRDQLPVPGLKFQILRQYKKKVTGNTREKGTGIREKRGPGYERKGDRDTREKGTKIREKRGPGYERKGDRDTREKGTGIREKSGPGIREKSGPEYERKGDRDTREKGTGIRETRGPGPEIREKRVRRPASERELREKRGIGTRNTRKKGSGTGVGFICRNRKKRGYQAGTKNLVSHISSHHLEFW